MTNLVVYTDFIGDVDLPNLDKDVSGFNTFVTKFQKEILIKLLGYDLYLAFVAGLLEEPIKAKWTDLKNGSTYQIDSVNKQNPGVKDIVLYYIYCKWLSTHFEQLTGLGVIQSNSDNATIISPENKITTGWNNMLNYYYMVYNFISEKESDYPNWDFTTLKMITYGF